MNLITADQSMMENITEFIRYYEHLCTGMAAQLKLGNSHRCIYYALTTDGNQICGVLCRTYTGLLFHLIPETTKLEPNLLSSALLPSVPYCFSGSKKSSLALEKAAASLWNRTPVCAWDYTLMTRQEDKNPAIPLKENGNSLITIRKGTPDDLALLLPLREDYERIEVLPPGQQYNKDVSSAALQQNLIAGNILVAWLNEDLTTAKPIGMACINANGMQWNQIGGVYTKPEFRRRGIAASIVTALVHQNTEEGKQSVLFVKNQNLMARHSYELVGFAPAGEYRLSYYL